MKVIYVEDSIHREVRLRAADRGCSMGSIVAGLVGGESLPEEVVVPLRDVCTDKGCMRGPVKLRAMGAPHLVSAHGER